MESIALVQAGTAVAVAILIGMGALGTAIGFGSTDYEDVYICSLLQRQLFRGAHTRFFL